MNFQNFRKINYPLVCQLFLKMFIEKDGEFRQVFHIPPINWCAIMDDGKSSNVLTRTVLNAARKTVPELLQKCPYIGHYELFDAKPIKELLALSPVGVLRISVKLMDDKKTTIFLSFLVEIFN